MLVSRLGVVDVNFYYRGRRGHRELKGCSPFQKRPFSFVGWCLVLYWQVENLKDEMRVLQLKVPLLFRYSLVYQKVQSSTGSMVIPL